MIYFQECQLCGYPIPFDPAFDVATVESGKTVEHRDGMAIKTCGTAQEMAAHIEQSHQDIISEDGSELLVPLDELFVVKTATNS